MKLYDIELYSVFTLYVIKKGNAKFICRKGNKENTYVEFFTKERIEVEEKIEVDCLSNYYSLLEVMDYSTMRPLRLSKKQILQAYLWINENDLSKDNSKDINVEIWQDYVETEKDGQEMPIINSKELIKK